MTKRKSKGAYMISAVTEMLRRLAGVSEPGSPRRAVFATWGCEAGARCRNPERSEGSL
jgi:hypothetical protein